MEQLYDDKEISVSRYLETDPSKDTLKPIKFQKLLVEEEEEDGNNESSTHSCWGCLRSFGCEGADALTQKLFQVFEQNLLVCPDEQLFAQISQLQFKLFVEKDPERNKPWTPKSVQAHITKHMIHSRYEKIAEVRIWRKMEHMMRDCIFTKGEEDKDFDPKKALVLLKVSERKQAMIASFSEPR